MTSRLLTLTLLSTLLFSATGCKGTSPGDRESVVVAIDGDVTSFNPLFAGDITAGEIIDLMYPGLTLPEFDLAQGRVVERPLLARSWSHENQGRDLRFLLHSGLVWSDSTPVTAHDVQLSYLLYGDPDVASVRQYALENLRANGSPTNIAGAVEVVDDTTVVFHFERVNPYQVADASLPILPAHIYEGIPRSELRTRAAAVVTSGPFVLAKATTMQEIVLEPNSSSRVPYPARLSRLVFRIVPDYGTRIRQLEAGEVDLVSGLRVEDADLDKRADRIRIVSTPGRDLDFLGWNNIDPRVFEQSGGSSVKPHPLFGTSGVRRALTLAINRADIVRAYLGRHGREAVGAISPLFTWAYNDTLRAWPYDPPRAERLLAEAGWRDSDGDGTLDRNGVPFAFSLKVPAGNVLRMSIASVIQQQLAGVGVRMTIDQVERATFWEEVISRKYDAWLAGLSMPLQLQLDDLWSSDLAACPFNLAGFQNKRVDEILATVRNLPREELAGPLWKEFQVIVHHEQPYTLLFWINSIVGIDHRVEGAGIGVLGTMHRAWEWHRAG